MQIRHGIGSGARLRHRIAAAELIGAERGARPIVGANSREGGDLRKHRFAGFGLHAPDVGAVAQAGLENDGRTAGSFAPEIKLSPAADIDKPGEIRTECFRLGGKGIRQQRKLRGGKKSQDPIGHEDVGSRPPALSASLRTVLGCLPPRLPSWPSVLPRARYLKWCPRRRRRPARPRRPPCRPRKEQLYYRARRYRQSS